MYKLTYLHQRLNIYKYIQHLQVFYCPTYQYYIYFWKIDSKLFLSAVLEWTPSGSQTPC